VSFTVAARRVLHLAAALPFLTATIAAVLGARGAAPARGGRAGGVAAGLCLWAVSLLVRCWPRLLSTEARRLQRLGEDHDERHARRQLRPWPRRPAGGTWPDHGCLFLPVISRPRGQRTALRRARTGSTAAL